MGHIKNPRVAGGSGKTELVRHVLAEYGWMRSSAITLPGIDPIHRSGRSKPFALRLPHPCGERPLVVLGHSMAPCTEGISSRRWTSRKIRARATRRSTLSSRRASVSRSRGMFYRSLCSFRARRIIGTCGVHSYRAEPLTDAGHYLAMRKRVGRRTGHWISLHDYRRIAATSIPISDPCNVASASQLLGYTTERVREATIIGRTASRPRAAWLGSSNERAGHAGDRQSVTAPHSN
jgi:hypothetical protein